MAELLRQFLRFTGVGLVSLVCHYALMILCVQAFKVNTVAASTAGFLLGAVVNYLVNYRYTFRSEKRHTDSVPKFAILVLVNTLLNGSLMWLGTDWLGMHYVVCQVLVTGLLTIWNFIAHRFWTFAVRTA